MILRLGVAVLVFLLAFDGGGYGLESRTMAAIAVWWAIIIAVLLGLWPLVRPTWSVVAAGGLVAAFAAWTAASITWAPSAENAFNEFNRVALYLGVYLVAVLAASRRNAHAWSDALAIGITSVGVLALASRLFPTVLPAGDVPEFIPSAVARLSYPVEYWNGLAILAGLSFPLLLRSAITARHALVRGFAVAAVPVLSATIFLTSSRGGFLTALLGTLAFALLTERRAAMLGAVAVGVLGSTATVGVLLARDELANNPSDSPVVVDEGRSAALLILLIGVSCAAVYALGSGRLRGVRIPSLAARVATVGVAAVVLFGIAASDPVERFETFKAPPGAVEGSQDDFVRAHLLSGNGSGRWQFWSAAVEEFETQPSIGRGAGSYESWWAEHGTIAMFVRDAHSLYLEALGELGIIGFLLVVSGFACGTVAGVRRVFAARGDDRVTVAALTAAFVAYGFAAGIDWMWELTIVSIIGIGCLGLLTGPATAGAPDLAAVPAEQPPRGRPWSRFALGAAALVFGWFVVCAQAVPLLTEIKISDSQEASRRGDGEQALDDALTARNLQPWAASPYLQLALVEEQMGNLRGARAWIAEAIARNAVDWRLWLVQTRIETKDGDVAAARKSLARAAELNPRSPLFADR